MAVDAKDYALDYGDELEIRIYPQENLTRKVRIPASKIIYFPMAGEIDVSDKGVNEVRRVLTEKLSHYLVNPQVSVDLLSQRSKNIYVLGEVTQAGAIPYDSAVRAVDAVTRAGGFTLNASEDSVVLIRNNQNQSRMKVLDLKNIINGEGGIDNAVLKPGDIVYVPRSFVADLDRFFEHVQRGLITGLLVEQGIVLYPSVVDAIKGVTNSSSTVVVSPK
ncbi:MULTISPECIES: polysaccharide biosynthesis/export family protein [Methylomonas]|uniref:polysaccharide biosynthesis/export family protein n=1 Tax=Methylomonas TaxID=416 RepID=UPI0016814AF7|nr:polysaccharide biosynthesis/export family protein [Methylomonas rhizoryzae]